MEDFTPVSSILGGALIGLSAVLVLFGLGRIAGVSGIYGGLLQPRSGDFAWRLAFVLGLLGGGLVMVAIAPQRFSLGLDRTLLTVACAGLLVGIGTRMGNGCTSGHGVCGVGRGSTRSLIATLTFMTTGILTVFLTRHVLGGSP
jgi:uncharacterized protein